jgi:hypothetical protein
LHPSKKTNAPAAQNRIFSPFPEKGCERRIYSYDFCIPSITQQGHYMMFTFYKTTVWMEIESFWDLHMISNPAIISIFLYRILFSNTNTPVDMIMSRSFIGSGIVEKETRWQHVSIMTLI